MELVYKDWEEKIKEETGKEYFKSLMDFVEDEYNHYTVYPPKEQIFSAFNYTSLKDVKVLIVGQDPYYNVNQAHGLAFSVQPGEKIPKSLVNIYKELEEDLGLYIPNHGYLKKWADQGVLMLNAVLTVRDKEPTSHKGKGWEVFTDAMLNTIANKEEPVVVILWGKPAQKKAKIFQNTIHHIIETPHPSPLSAYRGFFGSGCFSECNDFLKAKGLRPIDWQIENL